MRTSDLKADTPYATCDGMMVVPLEPIHAEHQVVYDPKKNQHTIVSLKAPEVPPTDPWGKCHPKGTRAARPQSSHRVGSKGIRCATFQVDRDGKAIEDTRQEIVVKPADISGTWKTYLTLYAHVVREKADTKTAEERRTAMMKDISGALAGVPAEVEVSRSGGWSGRSPNATVSLRFSAPKKGSDDELDQALDFAQRVAALYEEMARREQQA
jgi:hypothetical protein